MKLQACVLFFFLQMGLALLVNGYLTQYYFNDASISEANRLSAEIGFLADLCLLVWMPSEIPGQAVFEYFGTFSRPEPAFAVLLLATAVFAETIVGESHLQQQ